LHNNLRSQNEFRSRALIFELEVKNVLIRSWKFGCLKHSLIDMTTKMEGLNSRETIIEARNPYWRGRFTTIDLLVLTSLDLLLFIMETLFTCLQKQATLMRRSIVLRLPLQLVFPDWNNSQKLSGSQWIHKISSHNSLLSN
jgi:hypothetical protein